MLGCLFFIIGIGVALYGLHTGGTTGFMYLMGAVVLWLFGAASWGMDGMNAAPRSGCRPPTRSPGSRK